MQQLPTFNFGLTKNFFFIYRTLSIQQKTKNYQIRGSNAQKIFYLFYFPSHIPIWVWFVQKTRAKNSHAWAPLTWHILSAKVTQASNVNDFRLRLTAHKISKIVIYGPFSTL